MLKILCRGKTVRCEQYGCRAFLSPCQHALKQSHRDLAVGFLTMQWMHDLQADGLKLVRWGTQCLWCSRDFWGLAGALRR